jgi:hypothetical protein
VVAIDHKCSQQSSNSQRIRKYQRNLEKEAAKVPIPETTKLASENVAKDVLESGNDTSFKSNDLPILLFIIPKEMDKLVSNEE